ncbi:hypothetical protein ACRALDRAFT_2031305 [Sodiomyces alcalophilus JCM 7366]|uniref:uncharacterized protein n=1 Tax=Sodiomyces alcalophilus JCM 7366 TaxID=591952 RepID=UPI0039B60CB3
MSLAAWHTSRGSLAGEADQSPVPCIKNVRTIRCEDFHEDMTTFYARCLVARVPT